MRPAMEARMNSVRRPAALTHSTPSVTAGRTGQQPRPQIGHPVVDYDGFGRCLALAVRRDQRVGAVGCQVPGAIVGPLPAIQPGPWPGRPQPHRPRPQEPTRRVAGWFGGARPAQPRCPPPGHRSPGPLEWLPATESLVAPTALLQLPHGLPPVRRQLLQRHEHRGVHLLRHAGPLRPERTRGSVSTGWP